MDKTQLPNQGINLDLSAAEDIRCSSCGNFTFEQVVLLKKLSALMSPSGREGLLPIPVFACNACGNINPELIPPQLREALANKQHNIQSTPVSPPSNTPKLTLVGD